MRWAGQWGMRGTYLYADVVVRDGFAYMCLGDDVRVKPNRGVKEWMYIGRDEGHAIDHPWQAEDVRHPMPDGSVSEQATNVCRECWAQRNVAFAFQANRHVHVIEEFP